MIYNYNTFLRPITESDRNIKILDDSSNVKFTIEPFSISNVSVFNNILKIELKSTKVIFINFSTPNECKEALKLIQIQIDILTDKVPLLIDKDIRKYVDSKFTPIDSIDQDYIIDAIGYNPESDDNKVNDFSLINSILYPTTNAVSTYVTASINSLSQSISENLQLKQNLPTGFITGLELSINAFDNTKVDISPGAYTITDFTDLENIVVKIVRVESIITITPQYLNTDIASYIALDVDMNVVQSVSPFNNSDRRTLALIGAAIHSNQTIVNVVNEIKAPIVAPTNQLHDFMNAIGSLNLNGNEFKENGNNLEIDRSNGVIWGFGINSQDYLDPHRLTITGGTSIPFRYRLKDSTEYSDTQLVDPQFYDLDGVLTAVPSGKFTIQHFNIFQSGLTRAQYGQNLYDSISDAKSNINIEIFDIEKNIADNSIFRTYLIIREGVVDLESAILSEDAYFIQVGKFGNILGSSGVSLTFDTITTGLGYVPENVSNKVTSVTPSNNTEYPTTQAVVNYVTETAIDRIDTLDLIVNELSEFTFFIEGTYNELKLLSDNNELIPEKLYVITDYQHKYYIDNSNTSNIKTYKTVTGIISSYMVLNNNYEYTLLVGMVVTIESLPSGYTGTLIVGQTTTVTQAASSYYFRFTNGMHSDNANIGIVISFGLPRFSTLNLTGATVSDVNSKIVMKPGGVINTDVHDGTVYGDMSSSENITPPIESIILKAKSSSTFYEEAESLTFKNDRVIYDFNSSNIINDNLEVIGTRNGFITRRYNNILKIDINKDWRSQRYRRWLIPEGDYRSKLLNVYHPSTNDISATQSKYLYTSELIGTASNSYFYLGKSLETTNMTIGVSGSIDNYGTTFSTNQAKFKDYPIFRLDSSLNPIKVTECNIDNLSNSIFIGSVTNNNLMLSIRRVDSIINSTLQGYPQISGNVIVINNIITLDDLTLKADFTTLTNVNFLSNIITHISNTTITNTIFGSLPYNNYLSGLGTLLLNTPVRWLISDFNNSTIINTVIGVGISTIKISDSKIGGGSLFHYGNTLDFRDVNQGSVDKNGAYLGSPTNYKSFYSQDYKVRNILMFNKNVNITENINNYTLISDANSVIFYENRNVLTATASIKYYNETTKLFTTP